jgi:hypothetical protein
VSNVDRSEPRTLKVDQFLGVLALLIIFKIKLRFGPLVAAINRRFVIINILSLYFYFKNLDFKSKNQKVSILFGTWYNLQIKK